MYPLDSKSMRCPTCRAVQPWSDACRRCKCDLRLLRRAAWAYEQSRAACLAAVNDGQLDDAIHWASECLRIQPDFDARRLTAVCYLLSGQWDAACELADQAVESSLYEGGDGLM